MLPPLKIQVRQLAGLLGKAAKGGGKGTQS